MSLAPPSTGKPRRKRDYRKENLKARYGMSQHDFNAKLDGQGWACASCRTQSENPSDFTVDHDHGSDEVRGLLCRHCNLALGHLFEDPIKVERLLNYLRIWYTRKHHVELPAGDPAGKYGIKVLRPPQIVALSALSAAEAN